MNLHFADIWETVADAVPDAAALIHGDLRRIWRDYESRAARLAGAFSAAGIGPGAKVAIYARNAPEYLETQFALFKMRAISVNVNYRYVENELLYLLDNADCEAVVFQAEFASLLAAIRDRLPKLKLFVEVADHSGAHLDGAQDYEAMIAATQPMARIARSEDDIFMFFTGGTTGMPKGVMYRMGDYCRGRLRTFENRGYARPQSARELAGFVRRLATEDALPVSLPACPLMHATGLWIGAFQPHVLGGVVVTMPARRFDPALLWQEVAAHRVSELTIVGDAFAKPMLAALNAAREAGKPFDTSSLRAISSSGVIFSAETKKALLDHCDITILDAMGSTEGRVSTAICSRAVPPAPTARFPKTETAKVFADDGREVTPGSGEIGVLACGDVVPLGYYKDAEKSARTFRTIAGRRYSFPGDHATVAEDGTIVLLGRGSLSINTAGEKVFPEEVEEMIKRHPGVYDCLVVGVPDPRLGECVAAVVTFHGAPASNTELVATLRGLLAGYKVPKLIVTADEIRRAANGKADYAWAKALAAAAAT